MGHEPMAVSFKLPRLLRRPADFARAILQRADALLEASANQARLLNDKTNAIIQGLDNQSRLLNNKLNAVIAALDNQSRILDTKLAAVINAIDGQAQKQGGESPEFKSELGPPTKQQTIAVTDIAAEFISPAPPLLIAEKTYNTSHPEYDANVVRNFPGKIFNATLPCGNRAYFELKKIAKNNEIPDAAWEPFLGNVMTEFKSVAHAELVLQRRDALIQNMAEISARYNATYLPGWVNLEDAQFLYWLVRTIKPKTIVQCGVCNGLSAAFMTLALAKNGSEGKLYSIDIPTVFNPKDASWTISGKTYGLTIPEGKTSGWLVPEAYRKHFQVQNGDAKLLLPKLIDSLPEVDIFYHDSDHTYNHMMFEFREARRKIARGGLIVADDISWNAALWDFADEHAVPAYNYKGAVGVTFF
jgi:predicted O-methyltransferase YrrM